MWRIITHLLAVSVSSIPPQLGQLTHLTYLALYTNKLTGPVPSELQNLTKLQQLLLYDNRLTGQMPALNNLTNLTNLGMSTNQFTGSIPVLGTLPLLTTLDLSENQLSHTIPAALGNLAALTSLYLQSNTWISGTIPHALCRVSKLQNLALYSNTLTGSIPACLGSLTSLLTLQLGNQSWGQSQGNGQQGGTGSSTTGISGTIPQSIGRCVKLQALHLEYNALSGTIPCSLGGLAQLAQLSLDNNSLTGSIPSQLSHTQLTFIWLSNNRLQGTIPPQLANLSQLTWLKARGNQLSGSLPSELGLMSKLNALMLHSNSLSQHIPATLGSLPHLGWLELSDNKLTGSLPSSIMHSRYLRLLLLQNNQLSGTVPTASNTSTLKYVFLASNRFSGVLPTFPASVEQVIVVRLLTLPADGVGAWQVYVHQNQFTGPAPSFAHNHKLHSLALFGNDLYGTLVLPSAQPLEMLYAYENRLSCAVTGAVNTSSNLLLPGNMLVASGWMQMSNVEFLSAAASWWAEWKVVVLQSLAGVAFLAVLGWLLWRDALLSSPLSDVESLLLEAARMFALLAGGFTLVLCCLYYAGSNYFTCGRAWLHGTIAYLYDSAAVEWVCAVLACVYGAVGAASIRLMAAKHAQLAPGVASTRHMRVTTATIWVVVVAFLSIPSFVYALSNSLPGHNNTLGLSEWLFNACAHGIGPILALMCSFLIPWLAQRVSAQLQVQLVAVAQLFILLAVPLATALCMNQSCMAMWLHFWGPCQNPHNFEVEVIVALGSELVSDTSHSVTVLHHEQICAPSLSSGSSSKCARALLDVVGHLIVSKLAFGAFVSPAVGLVGLWLQQRASRARDVPYEATRETRILTCLRMWEIALVLGFCIPQVLPLACVSLLGEAAIMRIARTTLGIPLSGKAVFPRQTLWLSLCCGCACTAAVFHACDLRGKWVVLIGMPLATLTCSMWVHKSHHDQRANAVEIAFAEHCRVPLLLDAAQPMQPMQRPVQMETPIPDDSTAGTRRRPVHGPVPAATVGNRATVDSGIALVELHM